MDFPTFKFERKHNIDFFYKYSSAQTAKIILNNRSFRYSSPLIFNDPFDCQAGFHLEFNIDEFVKLFFDRVEQIVLSPMEPVFSDFNSFSEATMMMRDKVFTHGFPRALLEKSLGPIIKSISEELAETHQKMLANWENEVNRMRVLCVSEQYDNILMWSHYADFHRGVVLELKVAETEEDDDPLWIAQPVRYVKESSPLYTKDYIDELLGITPTKYRSLYDRYAYAKYDIWEYENEWRVFDLVDPNLPNLFEDNHFRRDKLSAIYFGCKCSEADIDEIIAIAKSNYSVQRFVKVSKHKYNYQLEFNEMRL